MEIFENPALFGHDAEDRIVAVEFEQPRTILVYRREASGATSVTPHDHAPFLWLAEGGGSDLRLEGDLPLRYLRRFDDWKAYLAGRAALRDTASFGLNDPVQQFLTASGKTLFKDMTFDELRRMQIGIQTISREKFHISHAEHDPLAAITLSDSTGWEEWLSIDPENAESERAALERLTEIIQERDPDVIEGHNLFKFDLPYLTTRAKRYKMRLSWGRDGSGITARSSRLQIAEKSIQYTRFGIRGRHLVDTFLLAQYYDVGTRELEDFDLDTVARHFGIEESGAAPELKPVRTIRALSAVLSASYFVQAQVFPYNYQDVIVRGNATKIDALFLREYLRQRHSLPETPEVRAFEGGYTDIFFTGVATNVWHCDVASLYPSVILRFGLLPKNDALGVFGGMLSDLRTFRFEAKTKMRAAVTEAESRHFSALQNTFKILINSFYGYLGFAQGHFADFDAASAVTAKGRELLRQMVAWLEKEGARVIEIDTDGIYFQPPAGATVASLDAGIRKELPEGIEVEFDEQYASMFSYKAKNYALLGLDGKLILKGAALKSRGMEPFLREFLERMIRCILTEDSAAVHALREQFESAIRHRQWPVDRLAKSEALQDSLASYQKKIGASSRNRSAAFELALGSGRDFQAGDRIRYYVTGIKKKVTAYENAKMAADWDPENRDENVEYYVGKLDDLFKKFAGFMLGSGGLETPELI